MEKVKVEAAARNYKEEYKKFQSSTKAKKYRAELNKYNRQKGTYGNGDGKDASHKGGKIVGFESQSKNRGRAEKSRLKKEGKLSEMQTKHKNFFLDQIQKDTISLKNQIAYTKDALKHDLEKWERKEYSEVLKKLQKDLKEMIAREKRVKKWEVSEGKLTEDIEPKGGMAKIAAIVKNKQHGKVGGKTVDMQSANLLMKLYNAVKDKDKEKMNKMNEKKLVMVLHKLWSRVNLKLPV